MAWPRGVRLAWRFWGLSWLRLGRVLGLRLGIWIWSGHWLVARLGSFLVLASVWV